MRNGKLLSVALAIIIAFSTFAGLAFAMIVPPEGPNVYAKFIMDPYYGTEVVIEYSNQQNGWMYIELFNPNNVNVHQQYILAYDDDVIIWSVTPVNGTWKLKYTTSYYGPLYDYATMYC